MGNHETRFQEWFLYVFDRPRDRRTWSYAHDKMLGEGALLLTAFLTRVFEESGVLLTSFTNEQVGLGLKYLSEQDSGYLFALQETQVPLPNRLRCIASMETLFEQCFAPRCSPYLGFAAVKPPPEDVNPLNSVCLYWWDEAPLSGFARASPRIPDALALDDTVLQVLRRILTLDSIACQESALLGLHCASLCNRGIDMFIDAFIDSHPDLWECICPDIRSKFFGRPWTPAALEESTWNQRAGQDPDPSSPA